MLLLDQTGTWRIDDARKHLAAAHACLGTAMMSARLVK
jgi:hypothetical protein